RVQATKSNLETIKAMFEDYKEVNPEEKEAFLGALRVCRKAIVHVERFLAGPFFGKISKSKGGSPKSIFLEKTVKHLEELEESFQ
ncbi:MAG: hypothetical protein J5601_02340, partial [Elusimicrobiaceae bacterium]|nr:hypothetical protein [Elusimicrobiaceae bacterium]